MTPLWVCSFDRVRLTELMKTVHLLLQTYYKGYYKYLMKAFNKGYFKYLMKYFIADEH